MMLRLELDDSALDQIADRLAARLNGHVDDHRSPWLNAQAAADYLGCSVSRVRKLTMLDDLPAHRDGGRVLYRRDELDAYIADGGASTGR